MGVVHQYAFISLQQQFDYKEFVYDVFDDHVDRLSSVQSLVVRNLDCPPSDDDNQIDKCKYIHHAVYHYCRLYIVTPVHGWYIRGQYIMPAMV